MKLDINLDGPNGDEEGTVEDDEGETENEEES